MVIDWTVIGAPPPTNTEPTAICFVGRRSVIQLATCMTKPTLPPLRRSTGEGATYQWSDSESDRRLARRGSPRWLWPTSGDPQRSQAAIWPESAHGLGDVEVEAGHEQEHQ